MQDWADVSGTVRGALPFIGLITGPFRAQDWGMGIFWALHRGSLGMKLLVDYHLIDGLPYPTGQDGAAPKITILAIGLATNVETDTGV